MKKMIVLTLALICNTMLLNAQNYLEFNVCDIEWWEYYNFCYGDYDSIIVVTDEVCEDYLYKPEWFIENSSGEYIAHYTKTNRICLIPSQENHFFGVYYYGCDIEHRGFVFAFHDFQASEPWTQDYIWKRKNSATHLEVYYESDCSCLWSNGTQNYYITVNQPGTYWVRIYNNYNCGELYDTIQIRDNVELYRATVDLETNLNKTTWQVTEEQAEYITDVKVYRDGLLVGTAPYEQGYFLDNIGSDNAARNYRIVGVSVEGEDCPIESYQKGTIHTTYYEDVNGNLNMTWNVPYVEAGAQGTLTYFQICKYAPATGEITVVDQVNASVTDYTCGVNQFDGGQAVIAAVFNNGKGVEELSFSNLTTDILGIGENVGNAFKVYPNPAKDCVTIEGTGTAIVTNALGQTILTCEIDGKATIELPQGLYFVKMNGMTRKLVVE